MRLFALTSSILFGLTCLVNAESIELKPDNIKGLISTGTWLIEHFSPYCPHCKAFAPEWKKLSEDLDYLKESSDFHFGTIDCSTQGDLCDEHDIQRYPTVQLWTNGAKVEDYRGLNKYDPLTEYILGQVKNNNDLEPEVFEDILDEEEQEAPVIEEAVKEVLPNPGGVSLELNSDQLREIYSGKIPWFIKFYAPWCPHCKNLAPTWVEMASQLKGQINVGEVNCDIIPAVCQEYGIRGFPTLEMFGFGEPIVYSSDRSLVSLMKFASAHSGPSVKQVNARELEQYLAVKDVVFVYVYNEKQELPEIIDQVGNEFLSTVPFFASKDEQLLKRFNLLSIDLPVALIAKDNAHRIYPSHDFKNSKTNRDLLSSWVENEQYPLVSKLGPNNHESILQGNHVVVLNIVNAKDTVSQSKFRNIATVWESSVKSNKKVIFGEMDRAMWRDYVLDKFNIQHDETSKIIIYDAKSYEYYTKDMNGQELSIDKPEELYLSLENLDDLKGETTLAVYERVGVSMSNGISWVRQHWIVSFFVFSIVGGFIYRYLTFHGPKRLSNAGLPRYNTHKD